MDEFIICWYYNELLWATEYCPNQNDNYDHIHHDNDDQDDHNYHDDPNGIKTRFYL